jgi:hypothetical protein
VKTLADDAETHDAERPHCACLQRDRRQRQTALRASACRNLCRLGYLPRHQLTRGGGDGDRARPWRMVTWESAESVNRSGDDVGLSDDGELC